MIQRENLATFKSSGLFEWKQLVCLMNLYHFHFQGPFMEIGFYAHPKYKNNFQHL